MKTLLVLEDDPDVMGFLRLMLEPYRVIEACSAEEAIRLFNAHARQVDLLVADLTLPKSSGVRVAVNLRSKVPNLPVILTSGYPVGAWSDRDSADRERLGSRSITILQKPFQAQELSSAVRELLAPRAEKTRTA
jgi:DNA-binding response OmpR family regulator